MNQKLFNVLLGLGCTYEVAALATRKVPTITKLLRRARRDKVGHLMVLLWIGFIAEHFVLDDL